MLPDLDCGLGMGWGCTYLGMMACVVRVWEVVQEEGKGGEVLVWVLGVGVAMCMDL